MTFIGTVVNNVLRIDGIGDSEVTLSTEYLSGKSGFNQIDLTRVSPESTINITLNDQIVDAASNNWVSIKTVAGQVVNLDADVSRSAGKQVRISGDGDVRLADGQFNQVILSSGGSGSRVVGGSGNEYYRSINASDTIEAGDGRDVISSFNGGDDYIDGGAGRDIVNLASNTFNANDTIIGGNGGGHDDIRINVKSDGYSFDTSQLNVSQIENIYFNGSSANDIRLKVDNDFINSAELDYVIVRFGARDVTLDASGLTGNNVVRLQGTGEVHLVDDVAHRVAGVNGTDGVEVFGGNRGDYFRSYNDGDTFHGGEGNDSFSDWQHVEGGDYFNGGAGNDAYFTRVDRLTSADTFDGGEGNADRIKYSVHGGFDLDSADQLANVSSVEIIQLDNRMNAAQTEAADISITLTEDFVASAANETVIIRSGALDFSLDTTDLAEDQTVIVDGSGTVALESDLVNTVIVRPDGVDGRQIIHTGGESDTTLEGTQHNDDIFLGEGIQVVDGGAGDDRFFGVGDTATTINGGAGDDTFFLSGNSAVVNGGTGHDLFIALTDNIDFSNINGGPGFDTFQVDNNGRILIGTFSFDETELERLIDGNLGSTIDGDTSTVDPLEIHGNAGNDYIIGSSQGDTLDGGVGLDSLIGNDGNDILLGRSHDDSLVGGNGDDTIDGGAQNDTIQAGAGDDLIIMTQGTDQASGDAGEDNFVFSVNTSEAIVYDFSLAEDTITFVRPTVGFDAGLLTIDHQAASGYGTVLYDGGTLGYLVYSDATVSSAAPTIEVIADLSSLSDVI